MGEVRKVFKEVGKEKVYKKGAMLFKEGSLASHMYFVVSGEVSVYKKAGNKKIVFAEFTKGDFFGEMAVLTGERRRASAEILTQSKISSITKKTVESLLEKDPAFSLELIKTVIKRLRRADKFLIQAFEMAMTIDEKIVHSTKLF